MIIKITKKTINEIKILDYIRKRMNIFYYIKNLNLKSQYIKITNTKKIITNFTYILIINN